MKAAKRGAMQLALDETDRIAPRSQHTMDWAAMGGHLLTKIPLFLEGSTEGSTEPPAWWYPAGAVVGVDFEGSPPELALIACAHGVAIGN